MNVSFLSPATLVSGTQDPVWPVATALGRVNGEHSHHHTKVTDSTGLYVPYKHITLEQMTWKTLDTF